MVLRICIGGEKLTSIYFLKIIHGWYSTGDVTYAISGSELSATVTPNCTDLIGHLFRITTAEAARLDKMLAS